MEVCNLDSLKSHFAKIGATLSVDNWTVDRRGQLYDIDIVERRRQGDEFFLLSSARFESIECLILDLDRRDRHLLLMIKQDRGNGIEKHRYLCGHDERSWFVAAVPDGQKAVSNVEQAKEALKPQEAIEAQRTSKVKRKNRHKRHNRGFLRQGEWFFVPANEIDIDEKMVFRNEPISRGRGKPHRVEFLYRRGGTKVYVSRQHPNGVSEKTYRRILRQNPAMKSASWRVMIKDPEVFGRGKVSHPDHATIVLSGWHKILPNTESRAPWIRNLTFLD